MKISRSQWLRVLAALALMLALVSSVSAQKDTGTTGGGDAPVDEDIDPTVLNLPLLEDGESIDLSFANTDGALLVAFNASEGDEVTISMTQTNDNLDPYLVVFNSVGLILAADDDSGDEPLSSLIEDLEIPADDSYFVLATSFSTRNAALDGQDGEDLTFEITVSGNTPPADIPEGSFAYSTYGLEIGESIDIEVTEEYPAAFITFIGSEGDEVTLSAPSDELDTLLMLFDYTGARIAVDDDGGSEPLAAEIADAELPLEGVYFAILTYYSYQSFPDSGLISEGIVEFSIE